MTYLPCADPVNDPDDWFIEKYGTQYSWEPLVTDDIWEAVLHAAEQDEIEPPAREVAEQRARDAALVRRRHARDMCFTQCESRLECLGLAIDDPRGHDLAGIRGGYYQEQLKKLVTEREKRASRRRAVADGE